VCRALLAEVLCRLNKAMQKSRELQPQAKTKAPIAIDNSIGLLDLRTPAEDVEFQECEAIVREGWSHFARVGEALARIRDKKLYKNEYASFELYCRERWGFGRSQCSRYIAASAVHEKLGSVPGVPLPECEAQIRPLIGLPAELAQQAWFTALSWTQEAYVPTRLVKRAVRKVVKNDAANLPSESQGQRMHCSRLRQSVRAGFDELLALLMRSAERDVIIAKVQEIQRLLAPLLAPKKTKV
jgi:hypothetical protein